METFFVYSLVFLFLAGFALFCVLIFARHPDSEEVITASETISASESPEERRIAYTVIAALFLFFLFLALQRKQQYYHYQLEIRR